jgi:hypothetical protein
MRLDHGPQRQLLQVPQLRVYERVQLEPPAYPGMDLIPRRQWLDTGAG